MIEDNIPETTSPKPKVSRPKKKIIGYAANYIGKGGHPQCAGVYKSDDEASRILSQRGVSDKNKKIKIVKG